MPRKRAATKTSSGGMKLQFYRRKIRTVMHKRVNEALFAGAETLRNKVVTNITTGSRSGERYKIPGTNTYYTASAPGEYPAKRTGRLADSYRIDPAAPQSVDGKVSVSTDVPYASKLEFDMNREHLGRTYRESHNEILQAMRKVILHGRGF